MDHLPHLVDNPFPQGHILRYVRLMFQATDSKRGK